MKRRKAGRYGYEGDGRRGWVRWNELGGGDDDDEDDYDEEQEDRMLREEAEMGQGEDSQRIPYEDRWEVDHSTTAQEIKVSRRFHILQFRSESR